MLTNMWELEPAIDRYRGLVLLVSSFLIIMFVVLQPLLVNAVLASRSICAVWWAVIRLLARDDSVIADDDDDDHHRSGTGMVVPRPRHYCEQCARRGTSFSDVAAVVASLGLTGGGAESDDVEGEDAFASGTDYHQACGGCAAMAVVDELAESKVASEAELREAFYVFDRDEDGFVTPAELWNVMRRLGMPEGARYDDCRRMIAAHDGDGDGRISFLEFRAMMENAA